MTTLDVTLFGAAGDGNRLDTAAIQRAIDHASAQGGGTVHFPAGTYRSTSLMLKSKVRLDLTQGAVLLASPVSEDWKFCNRLPLIYGTEVEDVVIEGYGEIIGSGPVFHTEGGYRVDGDRPEHMLVFERSSHITVSQVTIRDSVSWTVHFDDCEHVAVEGITIRNPVVLHAKNTDGIDINGCRHVVVRNCDIETGDDAICLKNMNTANPAQARPDMYDIGVYDCVLASTCNITKIGTETLGDIYDVVFDGITVNKHSAATGANYPADGERPISAVSVQSNDGGKVHDIVFRNYRVNEVDAPFFILLGHRQSKVAHEAAGEIDNITIENMEVARSYRTSLINVYEGLAIGKVVIDRVIVHSYETRYTEHMPDRPSEIYPEPWKYGTMPSYGLFARNVDGLFLTDSEFRDYGNSGRPEIVLEHAAAFGSQTDIISYGAIGDGATLNTAAIQQAIDDCEPGGCVYIPDGVFATGALFLRSGVSLYLSEGATLLGSDNPDDYPIVTCRFEGIEQACYASLINGGTLTSSGIEHVRITGRGRIDGNGVKLLVNEKKDNKGKRGRVICMRNGKNIEISGVTVKQSPGWCVHFIYCEDVAVNRVNIYTRADEDGRLYEGIHNGDGIGVDSSRNVRIENCMIASQDDCIAIKSGRDAEGRSIGIPSEHIVIANCRFHSGLGIAVGSEMSGGVRGVRVTDCVFEETMNIANVKAVRGRGNIVADVLFDNIEFKLANNKFQACCWYRGVINIDLYYSLETFDASHAEPIGVSTPVFENLTFRNIRLRAATGRVVHMAGLPESPLRNIKFENVSMKGATGFAAYNAVGLHLDNVSVDAEEGEACLFENVTDIRGHVREI